MLIENSCLLSPRSGEKQHYHTSSSNPSPNRVTSAPRPVSPRRRRPVSKLLSPAPVPAALAHCGAGRDGRMRAAWGRGQCARSPSPFPRPFSSRFPRQAAGSVWRLLPVGARCRASWSQFLVMSYGPLDMYRNPGSSGPQLRDFNSIIQTCSGNIQRISQASELGTGLGGRGHPGDRPG